MEIRTVADLMEQWRVRRGLPWRDIAKEAAVSRTTVDKIRAGEDARPEKVSKVEKALKLPPGAIDKFKATGEIPDEEDSGQETRVDTTGLTKGERLYETETEYGVRYRLETAEGHGASYTWPTPRPYYEIIPHLRKLAKIVATAGGLIDSE